VSVSSIKRLIAAHGQPRRLTDDGHDRLMIELRVIQTIQQMDRAGPEVARQTPTSPVNLACAQAMKAAISSLPHLHEIDQAICAVERAEDAVDAVARIPVDALDAPRRSDGRRESRMWFSP